MIITSEGKFNNLEDCLLRRSSERQAKTRLLPDGKTASSYEDLKRAFAEAVDEDKVKFWATASKFDHTVSH